MWLFVEISCWYEKGFFATLPSFNLFLKMLVVAISFTFFTITSIFFIIFLYSIYTIIWLFWLGISHHYVSNQVLSYPVIGIQALVALFYWLSSSYLTCVLFKRYQQEKYRNFENEPDIVNEISTFISCFRDLFKPFLKQAIRFLLVILSWYLISLSPFLVLGKYFINNELSPKVVFWTAVVYLCLTPVIFSTMFNLYLLCFQSIMNYIPKNKNKNKNKNIKSEELKHEAMHSNAKKTGPKTGPNIKKENKKK